MARGHTLEWFFRPYDIHWSRQIGCDGYRKALETRIRREVVSWGCLRRPVVAASLRIRPKSSFHV